MSGLFTNLAGPLAGQEEGSQEKGGVKLGFSRRTSGKNGIKKTAIQFCDDIEDAMCIVRGLLEYYDLNRRQIATICEIIRPIAEQLKELEKDLP